MWALATIASLFFVVPEQAQAVDVTRWGGSVAVGQGSDNVSGQDVLRVTIATNVIVQVANAEVSTDHTLDGVGTPSDPLKIDSTHGLHVASGTFDRANATDAGVSVSSGIDLNAGRIKFPDGTEQITAATSTDLEGNTGPITASSFTATYTNATDPGVKISSGITMDAGEGRFDGKVQINDNLRVNVPGTTTLGITTCDTDANQCWSWHPRSGGVAGRFGLEIGGSTKFAISSNGNIGMSVAPNVSYTLATNGAISIPSGASYFGGTLGIGDTTPDAELDVVGDILATASISAGTGVTAASGTFTATSATEYTIDSSSGIKMGAGTMEFPDATKQLSASPMVFVASHVMTAAATSITFGGLNMARDNFFKYYAEVRYDENSGANSQVDIFLNGNTTDAEYTHQFQVAEGAAVNGGRTGSNICAAPQASAADHFQVTIGTTTAGYPFAWCYSMRAGDATNIRVDTRYNVDDTNADGNITEIQFNSNQANGIGVGSEFYIWGWKRP